MAHTQYLQKHARDYERLFALLPPSVQGQAAKPSDPFPEDCLVGAYRVDWDSQDGYLEARGYQPLSSHMDGTGTVAEVLSRHSFLKLKRKLRRSPHQMLLIRRR